MTVMSGRVEGYRWDEPWPRPREWKGCVGLDQVLSEQRWLAIPVVLKWWAAMLLTLEALGKGYPIRAPRGDRALLLTAPTDQWFYRPGTTLGQKLMKLVQRWGLVALSDTPGLDAIPGKFGFWFPADLPVYAEGEPLPDLRGDLRFAAPEVVAGARVGPTADVFMAASLALTLLYGGTAPADASQVPRLREALPLTRQDLAPRLRAVLDACLCADPDGRPPTPGAAYGQLRAALESELDLGRLPPQNLDPQGIASKTRCGTRHSREAGADPDDPPPGLNQDQLLVEHLDGGLVALAVLDGVGTSDLGDGRVAAEAARDALVKYLRRRAKNARKRQTLPVSGTPSPRLFQWLADLAAEALRVANEGVVAGVVKRYRGELFPACCSPQTTVTLALLLYDHLIVSWVGDSPALFVDHSGAVELTAAMSMGHVALLEHSAASAYESVPQPESLAATLGAITVLPDRTYEYRDVPSYYQVALRLRPGSRLILATDGVLSPLGRTPDQRLAVVRNAAGRAGGGGDVEGEGDGANTPAASAAAMLDALWQEAERRGSSDDMTAIVFAAEALAGP
jgi:serine/threonine protein phosphatase PrpC